jgi:hypothetical protein
MNRLINLARNIKDTIQIVAILSFLLYIIAWCIVVSSSFLFLFIGDYIKKDYINFIREVSEYLAAIPTVVVVTAVFYGWPFVLIFIVFYKFHELIISYSENVRLVTKSIKTENELIVEIYRMLIKKIGNVCFCLLNISVLIYFILGMALKEDPFWHYGIDINKIDVFMFVLLYLSVIKISNIKPNEEIPVLSEEIFIHLARSIYRKYVGQ